MRTFLDDERFGIIKLWVEENFHDAFLERSSTYITIWPTALTYRGPKLPHIEIDCERVSDFNKTDGRPSDWFWRWTSEEPETIEKKPWIQDGKVLIADPAYFQKLKEVLIRAGFKPKNDTL
jgi:hypothetical protein